MIISLLALIIIIGGYFIYKLTKKINNLKNIIFLSIKTQVTENKLYLLDEIDSKSSNNLQLLSKELENIKKDIELFENPPKPESPDGSDGVQGPQGDDGQGVQGGPEVTPLNPTSGPQFQANEGVQGVQGPEA